MVSWSITTIYVERITTNGLEMVENDTNKVLVVRDCRGCTEFCEHRQPRRSYAIAQYMTSQLQQERIKCFGRSFLLHPRISLPEPPLPWPALLYLCTPSNGTLHAWLLDRFAIKNKLLQAKIWDHEVSLEGYRAMTLGACSVDHEYSFVLESTTLWHDESTFYIMKWNLIVLRMMQVSGKERYGSPKKLGMFSAFRPHQPSWLSLISSLWFGLLSPWWQSLKCQSLWESLSTKAIVAEHWAPISLKKLRPRSEHQYWA